MPLSGLGIAAGPGMSFCRMERISSLTRVTKLPRELYPWAKKKGKRPRRRPDVVRINYVRFEIQAKGRVGKLTTVNMTSYKG